MYTISVPLTGNSYKIYVGAGILLRLGKMLKKNPCGRDAVVITNRMIRHAHGRSLFSGLEKNGYSVKVYEVPDSEKSKSLQVAFELLEKIAQHDGGRRSIFIVAFGGGVIGDLAGFLAGTYKRGIPYIQVPTTFLAQIDSAIGGKVAVDLSVGKNLVGAFYQPKFVWSDVAVLSTLSLRQLRNGLAEAVKYGVIQDRDLFDYLAKNYHKILRADPQTLLHVVLRCSRIKSGIVVRDERETKGLRTILNFGHTLGHAIEAAGGYRSYHHGEAIALGMRMAAEISYEMGVLKRKDYQRLDHLLTEIGLPSLIHQITLKDIWRTMSHDKKFHMGENRFVLLTRIGHARIFKDVPRDIIQRIILRRLG